MHRRCGHLLYHIHYLMRFRCYCRACRRTGDCTHDGQKTATCGGCGATWKHHTPRPSPPPDPSAERDYRHALRTPGLGRRAWNFLKAVTKHAAGGFKHRDEEEVKRIAAICRECEFFNGKACTHKDCGCGVRNDERKFLNKLFMETEHCPIHKW